MFAYSIFAKIMNGSETEYGQQALQLISNIVHYIVANDFYLIDITGQPTSWGAWNPLIINWDRLWSDDRCITCCLLLDNIVFKFCFVYLVVLIRCKFCHGLHRYRITPGIRRGSTRMPTWSLPMRRIRSHLLCRGYLASYYCI
jgi:hypothetical protein